MWLEEPQATWARTGGQNKDADLRLVLQILDTPWTRSLAGKLRTPATKIQILALSWRWMPWHCVPKGKQ